MKVILNQDLENLGKAGDVLSVRAGYARNFLIPRSLAKQANEINAKALERHKTILLANREKVLSKARELAARIEKISVTVSKQVGEEERIFGTVTSGELEDLLKNEGVQVSKKDISLTEEVKKVGVYSAQVKLHPEIHAKFKVWVVAQ